MNYFKKRIGKGKGNRNMVGNFFFMFAVRLNNFHFSCASL